MTQPYGDGAADCSYIGHAAAWYKRHRRRPIRHLDWHMSQLQPVILEKAKEVG